jgi:hypothetical protein
MCPTFLKMRVEKGTKKTSLCPNRQNASLIWSYQRSGQSRLGETNGGLPPDSEPGIVTGQVHLYQKGLFIS